MDAVNAENDSSSELVRRESAFEELSDEILQVENGQLVRIRLDIASAVTTALGVLPKALALRSQIAALPGFNLAAIDKLESYALALFEAQAEHVSSTRPPDTLTQLVEDATHLRDLLYAEVQTQILRGTVDSHEIRDVRTGTGYKQLAMDLQVLANTLERKWEQVQLRTVLKLAEIQKAEQLARQLLRALGEREQLPAMAAQSAANRAKAFTLFIKSYEEVRHAVLYLRRNEGDGDKLVPSLYAGRNYTKRKKEAPSSQNSANGDGPSSVIASRVAPQSGVLQTRSEALDGERLPVPDSDPFLPT